MYDTIIVGTGPAGGSAALHLTKEGQRVLVLEKERLPRYKPCGGAVPKACLDHLPIDFSPTIEQEIHRVRFRFLSELEVGFDLPNRPIAMVMRDRFDHLLLQHSSAEIVDRVLVTDLHQDETGVEVVTRSGDTHRARYLIGADGANSRVARLSGLRGGRKFGVALEAEVARNDTDALREYSGTACFILGAPPRGYIWVFPKADHLSVGIGTFETKAADLKATLTEEMSRLGIPLNGRIHSHSLPVYTRHEPLHNGHVLLAGDAAGLADPLLGEGIRHAINSGRLAAEAVLADSPSQYTDRAHKEIGQDLLWGLRWARVFYKYPRACFDYGVRNPWFVSEFLRLFAGHTTYRQMAIRALPGTMRECKHRLPAVHPVQTHRGGSCVDQ